jgi:hypothetical protein
MEDSGARLHAHISTLIIPLDSQGYHIHRLRSLKKAWCPPGPMAPARSTWQLQIGARRPLTKTEAGFTLGMTSRINSGTGLAFAAVDRAVTGLHTLRFRCALSVCALSVLTAG